MSGPVLGSFNKLVKKKKNCNILRQETLPSRTTAQVLGVSALGFLGGGNQHVDPGVEPCVSSSSGLLFGVGLI